MTTLAREPTRRAILWSAAFHGGLLAFLALATLSCASWESFFGALGLPNWLNPVQCSKPVALAGEIIEATLVGPVGAPPPKSGKSQHHAPPPPPPQKSAQPPTPKPPPVKTLPPPPDRPDVKDQDKVVAMAAAKAAQAKQLQEQREKQRQSELEAERQKADDLLRQLEEIKQQRAAADKKTRLAQQRLQQLADLKKQQTADKPVAADVPPAEQARTGQGGADSGLAAEYGAALTSLITQNWLRPDNIPPGSVCPIHIVQIPGGRVMSVKVLPSCPFDESARKSVENAVLRAQPLPYKGYESVFQRDITLNFKVDQ
ncbi:MAG TPA: cell envelope integrity protein TolA [Rhodanobacteraceae bacterium]|nr:cell envelope integrity protein TolA [Rhodanobacteraceae bacterium]